jgi:hypothetical protein
MATHHDSITDAQAALLRAAKVFFVPTADPRGEKGPHGIGAVNVSPKGGVPLLLVGPTRVAWIDYPGSGADAAVVRLYGRLRVESIADSDDAKALLDDDRRGPTLHIRHVFVLDVESTMTSCGDGVPVMAFLEHRGKAGRGRRSKEEA